MLFRTICLALALGALAGSNVPVMAQSAQEFKNSYNLGKRLLGEGNLRGAKDAFEQVLRESPNNAYYLYGVYFYSLTALKAGDAAGAKQTLLAAGGRLQNWPQAEEAQFLLANAHFELGEGAAAYQVLANLKSAKWPEPVAQLKQNYLAKFELVPLKALYQAHGSDILLAEALYARMLASGAVSKPEDKALLKSLQVKLGKSPAESAVPSVLKSEYNVAVVLPFMRAEMNPADNGRRYQFVLDLYLGMAQAQQDLAKAGVKVNLFAYDSERDNQKLKDMADRGQWEGADLLVGPLYSNNLAPLAEVAQRNEVAIVNPISGDGQLLAASPHLFLTDPTPQTQARRAASFALKNLGGYANGPAYIYYAPTAEDSVFAHEYRRAYEQARGRVAVFGRLSPPSFGRVAADLRAADTLAHVLVCASEKPAAVSVLSAVLSAKKKQLPLLVPKSWLDLEGLDYGQLEAAQTHFIFPGFVPRSDRRDQLDRAFVAANNMVPSRFVYEGYETLYFFGQLLKRYGTGLVPAVAKAGFVRGQVLPGLDFSTGRDNQFVPICRFRDGALEVANWYDSASAVDSKD
jgi:ABC-type branched-subunit amino acid transport system substrate-binding protein